MSYSTPAMVRRALVPSSDGSQPATPSGTAADLADAELQDAISEADSTIDGYIGRYYKTPVDAVNGATPHPIDYWSRNLAAYNATLGFRGSHDFSDTDPVARRYNATMAALQAIAKGQVGIDLPENDTPSTAESGAAAPINPPSMDLTRDAFQDNIHGTRFGYGWPGPFYGIWVDRDRYQS